MEGCGEVGGCGGRRGGGGGEGGSLGIAAVVVASESPCGDPVLAAARGEAVVVIRGEAGAVAMTLRRETSVGRKGGRRGVAREEGDKAMMVQRRTTTPAGAQAGGRRDGYWQCAAGGW